MDDYDEYESGLGGLQARIPLVRKFAWLPTQVAVNESRPPRYASHKKVWLRFYLEREYTAFGYEMLDRYEASS